MSKQTPTSRQSRSIMSDIQPLFPRRGRKGVLQRKHAKIIFDMLVECQQLGITKNKAIGFWLGSVDDAVIHFRKTTRKP